MLYIRLIGAALILIYNRENKPDTYKIGKEKLTSEPGMELIRHLIQECGGKPEKLNQLIGFQKLE